MKEKGRSLRWATLLFFAPRVLSCVAAVPRLEYRRHFEFAAVTDRRRKQAHDRHHDWIKIRRGVCNTYGMTFTFLPAFSPPLYLGG
ncbi:MAG: hypothetical protein ACYDC6_07020 [Acidobacteriaceae bacterium]